MNKVGIIGKKLLMTQLSNGRQIKPVTAIKVGGNFVSQVKVKEKDGYNSCQISFGDCKEKSLNRPLLGHLKKNNLSPKKYLREIRGMEGFEEGQEINLSNFKVGEVVRLTGTTKGKGFTGVIRRYGFALGAMSHGGGYPHRLIGSMGGGRGSNQGVPKGKKMPGRMGTDKLTQNSKIERIDLENQIIYVQGSVPGPKGSIVILKKEIL